MKFFTVFALIASAAALPHGGVVNTGSSAVQRSDDGHGNYAFGYNEDHASGGTFRKEKGGPGYMSGSYGLRDADGRMRVVSYVADALGYRASVSTNEPGTDVKQDPAAVNLNIGHGLGHIPAPIIAAPIVSHAAPLLGHSAAYSIATAHPAGYGLHGGLVAAPAYHGN